MNRLLLCLLLAKLGSLSELSLLLVAFRISQVPSEEDKEHMEMMVLTLLRGNRRPQNEEKGLKVEPATPNLQKKQAGAVSIAQLSDSENHTIHTTESLNNNKYK